MGEVTGRLADVVVVTSDNPRSEEPKAIIDDIMKGVALGGEVHIEADRAKAIEFALKEAREGDVVLICGKGHETTQEIKGVKYPFDDRVIVKNFTKKP